MFPFMQKNIFYSSPFLKYYKKFKVISDTLDLPGHAHQK